MKKPLLALGVSAAALLAVAVPLAAQEAGSEPQMSFGTWGVDPSSLDPAVDPGDDFNAYVNGKWIRENPIPDEFTSYGAFNLLDEQSTSDVKTLIDDLVAAKPAAGTPEARIVDAYTSYADTDRINALGLAPAQIYLQRIFAARDLEQLSRLFVAPGMAGLISAGVTVDSKNPDSYAVSIGFSGMGLPDRDCYLVDSDRNREIQAKYKEYLAFLLGKAGYEDPVAAAEAVYAFEARVAAVEWDRTMIRNRDITYNKISRTELLALDPDFPMDAVLDAAGFAGIDTFLVSQLPPTDEEKAGLGLSEAELARKIGGGVPGMMQLLSETPLATLQAFMAAQFLSSHAPVLPGEIDQAQFAFFGEFLSGAKEQRPRWKRAVSATETQLGEQLGALYVARCFPPQAKAAMDELVANLRRALGESLAENQWMGAETKQQAYAKLASFTPKIGYPQEFETYDGHEIRAGDALGNRIRAIAWNQADERSKLGKPVDRSEWQMLPQRQVNAYYFAVFNEIVFPAAILKPPFFNASADPAVNYGAIGAVIGHEMGHGFDDQGSKYDSTGALRNWWQDEDRAAFNALGDRLVAQYNAICPLDAGQTCVNGRLTLGENIGDVGGLSMAYRAYRMSLGGKEAPIIDGMTGDQRFFLAWAQVWRSMEREEMARQRLLTDPRSPDDVRVNAVVRNMDAWYKAFNVTPDDDLYLPPEERVRIW